MSEFRYIVRIADTDLRGEESLEHELTKIKGVGINMSKAIIKKAGLKNDSQVGYLRDGDVQRIQEVLENPRAFGIPPWHFNRQRDMQTGENLHLIGSDLTLQVDEDIDRMKETRSWKGVRHSLGLKVRGQRTKTTGRSGRVVGVRRKRLLAERRRAEESG